MLDDNNGLFCTAHSMLQPLFRVQWCRAKPHSHNADDWFDDVCAGLHQPYTVNAKQSSVLKLDCMSSAYKALSISTDLISAHLKKHSQFRKRTDGNFRKIAKNWILKWNLKVSANNPSCHILTCDCKKKDSYNWNDCFQVQDSDIMHA